MNCFSLSLWYLECLQITAVAVGVVLAGFLQLQALTVRYHLGAMYALPVRAVADTSVAVKFVHAYRLFGTRVAATFI